MSKREELSERVSALSPAKRALLEKMRAEKHPQTAPDKVLPRPGSDDAAPLSFAQESLWFLHQLDPARHDYNVPAALRIEGLLAVDALERSLDEIARRHEVLRATFRVRDGTPIQITGPEQARRMVFVDLTAYPEAERANRSLQLLSAEARQPFDLAAGPLFRATLVRLGEGAHDLLLVAHHTVFDGWSIGIFIRELTALYQAFVAGTEPNLPAPPLQYADYAVWQRQRLQGDVLEEMLGYWRRQLGGPLPLLELPADHPRPASGNFRSGTHKFAIAKSLADSLATLSHAEGATLFMTLLAAFKVLLFRHTQQPDIIVGTPVANRTRHELGGVIGFFVNTLVLRTQLSGDPTFQELLARVREVTLGAYDHQDLPFSKLVETLRPERGLSHTPFVRATFWLDTLPAQSLQLPNVSLTRLEVTNGATAYDFSLVLQEQADGLDGTVTYNADIFEPQTIDDLIADFNEILESVARHPGQQLSALPPARTAVSRQTPVGAPQIGLVDEVAPAAPEESFELTGSQLLMWLGQQLRPDEPLYNELILCDIDGAIDPDSFREAFHLLAAGNDALRTTIIVADGVPRQRFSAGVVAGLNYLDLSAAPEPQRALDEFVAARQVLPFQLDECLYDTWLVKLAEQRFVWYVCLHHLITDAWSFALVYRRMGELYEGLRGGHLDERIEYPSVQHFIADELQYRHSPQYEKAAVYWQKKLAVPLEPLTFYERSPASRTTRLRRVSADMGAERTLRLKSLATQKGFSALSQDMALFNIFAALTFAYLSRINAHAYFSLGVPFHNRNSKTFRETVGAFMVVSPLRVSVADEETFASLVRKVQAETRETIQHSRYVTANPPDQSSYQVVLNYHNVRFGDFCGLPTETEMTHAGFGIDPLTIQVQSYGRDESLVLGFDFATDLFGEREQQLVVAHFIALLDACLDDPAGRLNRIDLLTPAERGLLRESNRTARGYRTDATVARLFEEQAERSPETDAVISGERSMTYRQLNEQANQLAHHLQSLGVGAETPVGLCVERSPEMLVGLFGIIKAGGVYVPLDPQYPADRLNFVLRETGAQVLLTQSRLAPEISAHPPRTIYLDTGRAVFAHESAENPAPAVRPDNLAYVLYTSGSTGRPKGVMIRHRSLVNYTQAACEMFDLSARDRVLQFASLSFDTASEEIFPCLARGGTLALRGSETLESPALFFRRCAELGITVLDLPTAYWHVLTEDLREVDPTSLAGLRLVIIGGEQASPGAVKAWHRYLGDKTRLFNTYGPTETTIVATACELTAVAPPHADAPRVTIGRAVANVQAHVLNAALQPMPVGAPGQLYIGGDGLARGYLNAPTLTAELFVPDPFSTTPGARLYRTGDMARYLPDGNIEFLGRADRQVKNRGFRIEPGEIESVLLEHPAIKGAHVTNLAGHAGLTLTAFLVASATPTPPADELRRHVQRQLPDYMLPDRFIWLPAFPLTPNGKIDHQALRQSGEDLPGLPEGFLASHTPEEKLIAGVWASLLDMDAGRIGVNDNFFDLGGHSLLGTQLMSRLNSLFEVEVPLRALFESPTIDGLAQAITHAKAEQVDAEMAERLLAEVALLSEEELDRALEDE